MPSGSDRSIDGEVTRVESTSYLEGATGHGVASLLCLVGGGALYRTGTTGLGVALVTGAFLLSANGFSIYAWDRVRDEIEAWTTREGDDDDPTRALTPYRVSTEMKAELGAGLVLVGGFLALLVVTSVALRTFGLGTVVSLAIVLLAIGNVIALAWTYRTPDTDDP